MGKLDSRKKLSKMITSDCVVRERVLRRGDGGGGGGGRRKRGDDICKGKRR